MPSRLGPRSAQDSESAQHLLDQMRRAAAIEFCATRCSGECSSYSRFPASWRRRWRWRSSLIAFREVPFSSPFSFSPAGLGHLSACESLGRDTTGTRQFARRISEYRKEGGAGIISRWSWYSQIVRQRAVALLEYQLPGSPGEKRRAVRAQTRRKGKKCVTRLRK